MDIPWLSNDAGSGASNTLRPLTAGDFPRKLSFCGDPYAEPGNDDVVVSIVGISYEDIFHGFR
jgi:hypothetical protein